MDTKTIKIAADDPLTREWAEVTGRFFLNLGMIEFLAMEFIVKMADGYKYKSIKKKFLSQKLTWIIENLAECSDAPPETVEAIHETLEEIRQLSFFRNVVANGAIGLAMADGNGKDAPAISGILNYRPEDTDQDAEIVSLEEVKGRVAESEDLARKLLDHLNGIRLVKSEAKPL
ncbi:MAG: hypothetical protein JWP91_746 [Fibrobacteres bacterium]|nr:hypothetical protein [Fibrobacterota bacterium]